MPYTDKTGKVNIAVNKNAYSRNLSVDAIHGALTAALSHYARIFRSDRKFNKLVNQISHAIAYDENWKRIKNQNGALIDDGTLTAFFNETSVAMILDAMLNTKPAYRKDSKVQSYLHWVEACNPIEIEDTYEAIFVQSFALIYKKFEIIKKIFNVKELAVISGEVEKQLYALCAIVDRKAPKKGSFHEYVKAISRLPELSATEGAASYSDSIIPFIGRAGELRELKEFCFSDGRLSWWSLTGAGGAGKSRLALELCRIIQAERKTWYCIFMPNDFFNDTDRFRGVWSMERNLLIVVDAPGFYISKLGTWLKKIVESDTVNRKIRILVLEREDTPGEEPRWLHKLKYAAGEETLGNLCYKKDCATLRVAAPDYGEYLDGAIEQYNGGNRNLAAAKRRIVDLWNRYDPGCAHPFILLMIFSAVKDNIDISACNTLLQFMDAIYEHKIKRIMSVTGAANRFDRLFVTVTLALALSAIVSAADPNNDNIHEIMQITGLDGDRQFLQKIANGVGELCAYSDNGAQGYGLDLFGEYFVVRTLGLYSKVRAYDRMVVGFAWTRRPYDTANFFRRLIDDFYIEYKFSVLETQTNILLFEIPLKADRRTAALYCELQVYLSAIQDRDGGRETAARIENLRNRGFTQERSVALRFAQSLFNLLILDEINGKETVLRMEELRKQGFEQDRDIAYILAQSMFILTAKQDGAGIKETVAKLEALRADGFVQDRDITMELVKALLNLTAKQDEAGRRETAARIEELRSQGFERDRDITLEYMKALLNLTIKQDKAEITETAARIEGLRAQGYENDKEMAFILAQALLNLTTKQDEAEIAATVEKMDELRRQGFADDRDITLELATALFNLSTHQDEAGVRKSVARLELLRNSGYEQDRDVTLRLTQTLFSLTTKQGEAGRRDAVDRIAALRARGFVQDREITLTYAKSLYNLSIEQDAKGARESVARLEELCSLGYEQDKDFKLLFAKSLYNLSVKLDETGIKETVTKLEALYSRS